MPLITDYPRHTVKPKPHTLVARAERFDTNSGVIEEYKVFASIQEMVTFASVENEQQRRVGYAPNWQVTVLDESNDETYGIVPMGSPWCP